MLEERIKARLATLTQAERETEMQLVALRNVIAELQALLGPEMTITQGEEPAAAAADTDVHVGDTSTP